MSEYFSAPAGEGGNAATTHSGVYVSPTFDVPGMQVARYCGSCFGVVVRSMGFAKGIGASFKSLVGGEVSQYTELLEDSRRHALDRMVQNAQVLGANAVIGFRFDSSEIGQQLTEIVAYGTAVVVSPGSVSVLLAIYIVIGAVILVAAVMSFFLRRHGESATPAGDWRRTDEVFVDPTTGRRMRVWIDPVDGQRHYVAD